MQVFEGQSRASASRQLPARQPETLRGSACFACWNRTSACSKAQPEASRLACEARAQGKLCLVSQREPGLALFRMESYAGGVDAAADASCLRPPQYSLQRSSRRGQVAAGSSGCSRRAPWWSTEHRHCSPCAGLDFAPAPAAHGGPDDPVVPGPVNRLQSQKGRAAREHARVGALGSAAVRPLQPASGGGAVPNAGCGPCGGRTEHQRTCRIVCLAPMRFGSQTESRAACSASCQLAPPALCPRFQASQVLS